MSTRKRRSSSKSRKPPVTKPEVVDDIDSDSDLGIITNPPETEPPINPVSPKKGSPAKNKAITSVAAAEESAVVPAPESVSRKKVIVRTVSACVMTLLYLLMLQAGHFYCILVRKYSTFIPIF